jgi:intracellular septation protein A
MEAAGGATTGKRAWALLAALVVPLLALPLLPPIAQDPRYHAFADTRFMCGVANFQNVASNLGFLLAGVAGLAFCWRRCRELSWLAFFAGVVLVAFGSAYYHLQPNDETLVWDRLPMTIAFMALFTALLKEHLMVRREGTLLALSIAVGIASIAWWRMTGDLKFYVWVQVAPFLAIAVLLALYRGRYTGRYWLAYGLLFYALAKVTEFNDLRVYALTGGLISGHALKHLLAAVAPLCVYVMLKTRVPSERRG